MTGSPEVGHDEHRSIPRRPGPLPGLATNNREVIDVDELSDSPPVESPPEVELLYQRHAPPRRRFQGGGRNLPPLPFPRPVEPGWDDVDGPPYQPHFHQDIENPILAHGPIAQAPANTGLNRRLFDHPPRPGVSADRGIMAAGMVQMIEYVNRVGHPNPTAFRNIFPGNAPDVDFQAPVQLDYVQPAPGIFRIPTPPIDAAATRNADYKAPPEARSGYTRSPKEGDVLVCVSCDQELGAESLNVDGDEVWAAKCGHVSLHKLHLISIYRS